jgi:hypothetical protein
LVLLQPFFGGAGALRDEKSGRKVLGAGAVLHYQHFGEKEEYKNILENYYIRLDG